MHTFKKINGYNLILSCTHLYKKTDNTIYSQPVFCIRFMLLAKALAGKGRTSR